ncbi:MAG: DUF4921 family protein [Planctomycetes bacterium]|nr:DUF4921 family protein [Planctomycetota bacterium]
MPELRTDWLTGRSVIVAENRADRPNEFANELSQAGIAALGGADSPDGTAAGDPRAARAAGPGCPFCPGHERDTPPAVYEQCDDEGHWQVRVIPNKYPAVTWTANAARPAPPVEAIVAEFPSAEISLAPAMANNTQAGEVATAAFGAHEVIIESSRHLLQTAALSIRELRNVLAAYFARLQHWREDGRLKYALVFKNQGPAAGASLGHLHSQLMALPAVPPNIIAELRRAEQMFRRTGDCPYCRLIARERAAGQRIVLERDGFVAFCPAASLQPLETWLLPADHEASFETPSQADRLDRLAGTLHTLIARLETLLPGANYNLFVRTMPWLPNVEPWSHWRIELLPRVASLAGIELGAGVHINPFSPEHAASRLRLA